MRPDNHQGSTRFAAVIGAVLVFVLITVLFTLTQPVLTTQAALPSLNTPTPRSSSGDDDDSGSSRPPVAHIELHTQSGRWSVVQWQDSDGNWHDVDGWRGSIPESGIQRWAVEAKDFGTGPFQWVVMQGQSGSTVGTSAMFNLPAGANETVRVTVTQ